MRWSKTAATRLRGSQGPKSSDIQFVARFFLRKVPPSTRSNVHFHYASDLFRRFGSRCTRSIRHVDLPRQGAANSSSWSWQCTSTPTCVPISGFRRFSGCSPRLHRYSPCLPCRGLTDCRHFRKSSRNFGRGLHGGRSRPRRGQSAAGARRASVTADFQRSVIRSGETNPRHPLVRVGRRC